MFTRSGKRVYSFYENSVAPDMDSAIQSERKTRSSRRFKENVSESNVSLQKPKKRSNYVSYPTDDDEKVPSDDSEVKHGRILRKNTLKELNIATENIEHFTEPKNPRKSRRGKKNIEHISQDTQEVSNIEDENLITIEKDKSKKYKKKKMSTLVDKIEVSNIKLKNKKKGKRSNKIVIEDSNQRCSSKSVKIMKSMSIDSFHSAAGSLDSLSDDDALEPAPEKVDTTFVKDLNNTKNEINGNVLDHDVSSRKSSSCVNNFNNSISTIKKKDATFDKSNSSISNHITNNIEQDRQSITSGSSTNEMIKAQSFKIHNATFDKSSNVIDTTFEKATTHNSNSTYDKIDHTINTTFDYTPNKKNISSVKDNNLDKNNDTPNKNDPAIISVGSSAKKGLTRKIIDKSNLSEDETLFSSAKKQVVKNSTIIDVSSDGIVDWVSEDCQTKNFMSRKQSINDASLNEIVSVEIDKEYLNLANKKSKSDKHEKEKASKKCNSPYNKESASTFEYDNTNFLKLQSEFSSDNQEPQLDATYDKDNLKSSLLSSDNSEISKSDISQISITTDDSTENIDNTLPVLIESSVDESSMSKQSTVPQTPLKREGTFTKEPSEVQGVETPSKQNSSSVIFAAGCTPYHISKSSHKSRLNITRSLEKNDLSMEPAVKTTKVMFCSPVNNPATMVSEKRKIIKSNLKGSNKSFVFEDKVAACAPPRKRSYTQNDAEDARAKRKRLADGAQQSVDRLSRPRTNSASAKLFESTTPSKNSVTPSKSQDQPKPVRTRLPNFAALHQRQFAKMESLDECLDRKARRAKQLLTPTGALDMLYRISPKNTTDPPKPKESVKKTETPTKQPTVESLRPGFTRFGFKLNLDRNPFSVPAKILQPKPDITLSRQPTLPSLSGVTSIRKQRAKQMVMREKSFTDKRSLLNRNENRTFIKGVRTNRRFELQMKMRQLE